MCHLHVCASVSHDAQDPGDTLAQGCHERAIWKRACVGQSRPTEYFLVASHGFALRKDEQLSWKPRVAGRDLRHLPAGGSSSEVSEEGKAWAWFYNPVCDFHNKWCFSHDHSKWALPCCPALGAFIHSWSCSHHHNQGANHGISTQAPPPPQALVCLH